MQTYLSKSFYQNIDEYGSYSHTRVFKLINWDESILGPSPELRWSCDVLPMEGDERYYHWEIGPMWA